MSLFVIIVAAILLAPVIGTIVLTILMIPFYIIAGVMSVFNSLFDTKKAI